MQNGRIFFSMCKNYNKITSFFCLCRIYSLSLHSHMKKWPSVIRQSLSTKLSLWLVAFVAVMLVAALFVMFMYARRAVKAEALAKSEAALDGMMQSIDNKLHEVEVAANNIHWRVEGAIDNPAALQQLTRKMEMVIKPCSALIEGKTPSGFLIVLEINPTRNKTGMCAPWLAVKESGAIQR